METASSSPLSDAPSDVTVYHLHIEVTEKLNGYVPEGAQDDTKSFLGATFQFLPRDGKMNLEADIRACQSDVELRTLAKHIDTALILPLRAIGGQTKPVTPSPRYDTNASVENLVSQIDDPVKRQQTRIRREGLSRDNNRCVLTNLLNEELPLPDRSVRTGKLIAAHIIPFSMGNFTGEDGRFELAAMWQSLYRYFPGVRNRLNASMINDIKNAMMLESSVHDAFGAFKIALEPLPESDKYRIFYTYTGAMPLFIDRLPPDNIVTMVSHDPQYALPDRTLLETHYLVARIIHATGRAEVVEKILRDYGETGAMATDGSTDISQLLSVTSLGPLVHSHA